MDMFRHRDAPILQYPTFHSTIVVSAEGKHYKITNVLFDSGASSNFISRKLCKRFGLKYYPFIADMTFNTANGQVQHTEEVDLTISIAGVFQNLSFIRQRGLHHHHFTIILGTPGFWKYQLQMRWGFGAKRETLVTIEADSTLQPNVQERNIVVEAEQRHGPSMVIELKDMAVQNEALKLGETVEQRQERQGAEAAAVSRALQEVEMSRAIEDALAGMR
ncbi:hypothetical protein CLAFUW4_02414 [Fulvia fulva]|uniref:Uncharacterized protein n=1 Tax=Passalora fulva TaxID=5499 RepID=A0A9Q8LCV2_PASFU|nr:uncharacterized protein CLAFUR5_02402 [Fulvia fulva]KAK4631308.1 hypothetical protein CLAFUR4_02409 [Fulvia fulva]KAK4633164.1 hypothetical protein CLAFUR0_02413 [Fulvia fulva]UJO14393.1 hypothetical protein CLAFUR5_02402 [Fulvia fulva]WPV10674.1 hypothetical protein CLAFUW4_02414 [Fulvia fulva]WPV25632.1 hypothetical protein CLAFUW7_02414 [Fulvia fulva]